MLIGNSSIRELLKALTPGLMEGQTCVIVESLFQLKMHLGCLGPSKKYIFFWFSSALVLGINTLTNFTFNFIWKNASKRVIGAPFFSHKSDSTITNVHPSVSTSVSKTPQIALIPSCFILRPPSFILYPSRSVSVSLSISYQNLQTA